MAYDGEWTVIEAFGGPKGSVVHGICKYGDTTIQIEIHPDGAVWMRSEGQMPTALMEACRTYAQNWGYAGMDLKKYLYKVLGHPLADDFE